MIDILSPYLSLISLIVVIIVNVLLILFKGTWYTYLIGNVIVIIVLSALFSSVPSYSPFDFFGAFVDEVGDFIINLITKIINGIITLIQLVFTTIFRLLFFWLPTGCGGEGASSSYTGGGGGGVTLR